MGGCTVRDGITCYLLYHNVTRILGWEGLDGMLVFFFFWGGCYNYNN